MKKTNLLVAGAFVGVFSLGALFSPIGKSFANTNTNTTSNRLAVMQTANENAAPKADTDTYNCPMTGGAMGSGGGMMGQSFAGTMPAVIADALGMTVDELQAARQDGKSVADIAADKGVKEKDLLTSMMQSRKAELEKLVKDGTMTQEQMDQMLKNMESMMKIAIQRDTFGPMNGHGKGMGKGQGMGHGQNNTTNTSQEI